MLQNFTALMVEHTRSNHRTIKKSAALVVIGTGALVCCELTYTGTAPLSPLGAGLFVAGGVGAYSLGRAIHKLSVDEKTLSTETRL
jgi:hypothetical protein